MRPTRNRTFKTTNEQRLRVCEVLGLDADRTTAICLGQEDATVSELVPDLAFRTPREDQ